VDGDGHITEKDFELIAQRFHKFANFTGKEADDIEDFYRNKMWKVFFKPLCGGTQSKFENFIENMKKEGDEKLCATKDYIHGIQFDIMDKNKDGFIQLHELVLFFNILGIPETFSVEAFHAMDVNHDGGISREEFLQAGRDYFCQEEKGYPGDYFLGPLLQQHEIIKIDY